MAGIHEIMEYGAIVANDEDYDLLISVNGAYFNVWAVTGSGDYTNTDAFAVSGRVKGSDPQRGSNGLYGLDYVDVVDAAEALMEEIITGSHEDDDDYDDDGFARFG